MTDRLLTLHWLPGRYAVCRLDPDEAIPSWVQSGTSPRVLPGLICITRTERELSIVIDEDLIPSDVQAQRGFSALRVEGVLDFSQVGILAKLTSALAGAKVPALAISTFETDVLLIRQSDAPNALKAFAAASAD